MAGSEFEGLEIITLGKLRIILALGRLLKAQHKTRHALPKEVFRINCSKSNKIKILVCQLRL